MGPLVDSHPLKKTRIASQTLFFFTFLAGVLFSSEAFWPLPKDFFFLLDPLVTFVAMFSAQTILFSSLAVSCLVLLLTIVFGRFFCGWICPLGTMIDIFDWFTKGVPKKQPNSSLKIKLRLIKFGILIFTLIAAGLSFQFIYFFDPIVIMTRFAGMVLIPVAHSLSHQAPFAVQHSIQFIFYVIGILSLSLFSKRFWCRVICPLGALFGLIGRFSIFGFYRTACKGCPRCHRHCPTGSISEAKHQKTKPEECVRCYNCLSVCPTSSLKFGLKQPQTIRHEPVALSRRTFLAWSGGGICSSLILTPQALGITQLKSTLRPPHAPDEELFLNLCIRCQACTNVCPTNALQPIFMQSGLGGLWSPSLMPSIGACQTDCTRCSTVCPTGAIGHFDLQSKYTIKIGTAILLKNRCVSYSDGKPCGKCIPKCPTGAIAFIKEDGMDKPNKIDFLLCVGCGICEHICNKQTLGPSALIVTANGRNQPSGVPQQTIDRLSKEPGKYKFHKIDTSGCNFFERKRSLTKRT
jgi:polyferredoxin/Pyruvate/2-oxoacid:ferredoxin oxidoreductase delta subunit